MDGGGHEAVPASHREAPLLPELQPEQGLQHRRPKGIQVQQGQGLELQQISNSSNRNHARKLTLIKPRMPLASLTLASWADNACSTAATSNAFLNAVAAFLAADLSLSKLGS